MKFEFNTILSTGNRFLDSEIGRGVMMLLNDLSFAVMTVGPLVCCVRAAYFMVRAAYEEDMSEQPRWKKRATTAVYYGVAALLVGAVFNILTSYFK